SDALDEQPSAGPPVIEPAGDPTDLVFEDLSLGQALAYLIWRPAETARLFWRVLTYEEIGELKADKPGLPGEDSGDEPPGDARGASAGSRCTACAGYCWSTVARVVARGRRAAGGGAAGAARRDGAARCRARSAATRDTQRTRRVPVVGGGGRAGRRLRDRPGARLVGGAASGGGWVAEPPCARQRTARPVERSAGPGRAGGVVAGRRGRGQRVDRARSVCPSRRAVARPGAGQRTRD